MALSLILRTGLCVDQTEAALLPEQAWSYNRLAAGAVPESSAATSAGPTILAGFKGLPRLSSHKFQSHCNVQAHHSG
jgi:hypothetical protein